MRYRTGSFAWWALALGLLAVSGSAATDPAPPHVILISIDGLRPEVYREPDKLGIRMPNLVALREAGVSAARMIPVFPSLTYPAHTTMVTGTRPAEHGIVSNFKSGTNWYLESREIQVPTLWSAARAAGLSTAIVTWPVSYGADVTWRIPENLSFGVKDLAPAIREGATPGLFAELEPRCEPVVLPSLEAVDAGEKMDQMTSCFAARLIRDHQPNFVLMHFLDADHRQHASGPASPEALHAFELIDGLLGEIRGAVRAAGIADDTVYVIVGDHGFTAVHTNINLSAILLATKFATLRAGKVVTAPEIRISALGGSAAVYVAPPKTRAQRGMAARLEKAFQAEIDRRYAGLIQLLPRAELDRLGAFPGAAFGLAASEGYVLVAVEAPQATLPAGSFRGMHGYLPSMPAMATGFIAAGPGVRQGVELPLVRQLDVAPTLAVLLGVELPSATGLPLTGIFDAPEAGPGLGIRATPEARRE